MSQGNKGSFKRLEDNRMPANFSSDPIPENPISQYNQVIEQYNLNLEKDECELETAECTLFYEFIFAILKKPLGKFILTGVIVFLPLINFFFYFLLWNSYFVYSKALEIYKKNKQKVTNPLVNMIQLSDLCDLMNKNFYTIDVNIQNLKQYNFWPRIAKELKNKQTNGKKYLIYNTTFKSYYFDFPRSKNVHIIWLVWSTILLAGFFGGLYFYILILWKYV